MDFLAPGRVIMAVGLGADEHEAAAFNVPLKQRGTMTDEGIAILRKLWTAPDVSHHGKYYQFERVTITPRPAKNRYLGRWPQRCRPAAGGAAGGRLVCFVCHPQEFAEGQAKIAAFAVAYGRENDEIEAGSILFCHVDADGRKPGEILRPSSLATHAVHLR